MADPRATETNLISDGGVPPAPQGQPHDLPLPPIEGLHCLLEVHEGYVLARPTSNTSVIYPCSEAVIGLDAESGGH